MDAKSLARSKRSHSLQHSKKSHPKHTSKPSAGGTAAAKKPPEKQVSEKARQSHGLSSLPSNRDRYEEEYDSGSEDLSRIGTSQVTDVIKPKSKGADYSHLISEAQSQSQSQLNPYMDSFASFDDTFYDFDQGVGSILSVRGEDILSRIGDGNFIVEDKATTSHEAPFLSLNLHLLAEQLAKVDPARRLFVEADLLPLELYAEGHEATTTCQNEATTRLSDEFANCDLSDKDETMEPSSTIALSVPNRKTPVFEVAGAEAELDMLLDSYNKTRKDKSGTEPTSVTANFDDALDDLLKETSNLRKHEPQKVRIIPLDDAIDDLLAETSNLKPQKVNVPINSASNSGGKSKVLDDFDSWFETI